MLPFLPDCLHARKKAFATSAKFSRQLPSWHITPAPSALTDQPMSTERVFNGEAALHPMVFMLLSLYGSVAHPVMPGIAFYAALLVLQFLC